MKVINQDEYGRTICSWFKKEFYNSVNTSAKDLLEILTSMFLSTKEYRYGPIPEPESLVVIRETIRKSIELGHPIPILVPWGGRKAVVNQSVDMAEVFALNQVNILQSMIQKYYSPGIMVNIRIEDTNADWIYRDTPSSKKTVEQYSSDFVKLITLVSNGSFINPVRESSMLDPEAYFKRSDELAVLLERVINLQLHDSSIDLNKIPEFKVLQDMGWKGLIPEEQRNYYLNRYETLYPGQPKEVYVRMLADYFGGAKARHDMKAVGNPITPVGSHIVLSFVAPIPGAPESLFNNRIYWRTVPYSNGRTHMPPWRAKGFFKIENGNQAKSKITSFNDPIVKELIPSTTILQNGSLKLELPTDYIVE